MRIRSVLNRMLKEWRKHRAIRSYIHRLPRLLVERYGYRQSYTPAQIRRTAEEYGFDVEYLCYAYATFSDQAGFEAVHADTGQDCHYEMMREEVGHDYFHSDSHFTLHDVFEPVADSHGGHDSFDGGHHGGDFGGHHFLILMLAVAMSPSSVAWARPYVWFGNGELHVTYRTVGNTIEDVAYTNPPVIVDHRQATPFLNLPWALQGSPSVAVWGQDPHIAYRSCDAIVDIFPKSPGAGLSSFPMWWEINQWGNIGDCGGTPYRPPWGYGPPAAGDPFVWVYKGAQLHFTYRNVLGAVYDTWTDGPNSWHSLDLYPYGSPAATDPVVAIYGVQQHVAYTDKSGFIWDNWYDGVAKWSLRQINPFDLSSIWGNIRASGRPHVWTDNNELHFTFASQNFPGSSKGAGTVFDTWFDSSGNKNTYEVVGDCCQSIFFAPPAAGETFVTVYSSQRNFIYRDAEGTIWDGSVEYDSHGNMIKDFHAINTIKNPQTLRISHGYDLTPRTTGNPAVSDPVVALYYGTMHIVYQDSAGILWDACQNRLNGQFVLQQVNGGGLTNAPPAAGN